MLNKWIKKQVDYMVDEDNDMYDDYDYYKEIHYIYRELKDIEVLNVE